MKLRIYQSLKEIKLRIYQRLPIIKLRIHQKFNNKQHAYYFQIKQETWSNKLIFNRKIYDALLNWKKSEGKEALLIEGARRVGKSTIVQEFAKKEYDCSLLIDFARTSDEIKQYFVRFNNDLNTLFMMLQNVYGVELKERKSLIIFDEVQRFPTAREMIKYHAHDLKTVGIK